MDICKNMFFIVFVLTSILLFYNPIVESIIIKRIEWKQLDLDKNLMKQAFWLKDVSELESFVNETTGKIEINGKQFISIFNGFYKNTSGDCTPSADCIVLYCKRDMVIPLWTLLEGCMSVNMSIKVDDNNNLKEIDIWSPSD